MPTFPKYPAPDAVIEVDEAYGKTDAVFEVAVYRVADSVPEFTIPATVRVPVATMFAALRFPENNPLPCTPIVNNADGEVVPTPTFWVKRFAPVHVLLSARRVDDAAPASDVRYPASLVHCDTAAVVKLAGESVM
jgi:hypothetical protein